MKRRELERRLRDLGWTLQRHGGKHDVWISADGDDTGSAYEVLVESIELE